MNRVSIPIAELNRFDLPAVCLTTGSAEGVSFRRCQLRWTPPWVYWWVVFPYVGYVLIALIGWAVRRRVEVELPFTDLGWRRHRQVAWWRSGAVLFLVVAMFVAAVMAGEKGTTAVLGVGLLCLSVLLPFAIFRWTSGHRVRALGISPTHVVLEVADRGAALRVLAHLRGDDLRLGDRLPTDSEVEPVRGAPWS